MINWESILPKRIDTEIGLATTHQSAYNEAWWDFLKALKAAEARGEICKPLSVIDILELIDCQTFVREKLEPLEKNNLAELIHNALTKPSGEEGKHD